MVSEYVNGALFIALAALAGALAIWTASWFFSTTWKDYFNWRVSIQEGNRAVAVATGAAILATAIMVQGGLQGLVFAGISGGSLAPGFARLIVGFLLSVLVVNGGSLLFDLATPRMRVGDELNDGNVAVAMVLGTFMVGSSWVVSTSITMLG